MQLLPLYFATTRGHKASFEALPRGGSILPLSAPSARQGALNTDSEELTEGSPSHLAWNPEVGSQDQPHLLPQTPHLRHAPRAHIEPLPACLLGCPGLIPFSIVSLTKCPLLVSERTFLSRLAKK